MPQVSEHVIGQRLHRDRAARERPDRKARPGTAADDQPRRGRARLRYQRDGSVAGVWSSWMAGAGITRHLAVFPRTAQRGFAAHPLLLRTVYTEGRRVYMLASEMNTDSPVCGHVGD